MSKWEGFDKLDLSDVGTSSSERRLKAGRYVCDIADVELQKTKDGKGRKVYLKFADTATGNTISDYINVFLPGKEKAQEIGRERLKTLLTFAGHANPNQPGDLKLIKGHRVGVVVEPSQYEKDGQMMDGSEVARWGAYFDPSSTHGLGETAQAPVAEQPKVESFDDDLDDVPF